MEGKTVSIFFIQRGIQLLLTISRMLVACSIPVFSSTSRRNFRTTHYPYPGSSVSQSVLHSYSKNPTGPEQAWPRHECPKQPHPGQYQSSQKNRPVQPISSSDALVLTKHSQWQIQRQRCEIDPIPRTNEATLTLCPSMLSHRQ